jgi:polar amino acid transport system substrate-binding protein
MKKILKVLLILITILNFMAIMLQGTIIYNNKTKAVNSSIEKNRLQTAKEKGVITVATPLYDFPFFYIKSETNKISGIDADIITEIAKRLEIDKVEMKETVFSNLLEKLNNDSGIDMAVGGIYITSEREELVAFTEPLYKEAEVVVVPRFSKINFITDLKNSVVGVEKGTVFVDLAQRWKENNLIKDIVIYENTSDLLNDINNEKIEAGIADSVVVSNFLSTDKKLQLRTLKDYTSELPGTIGIAVRKNDHALVKELNKIINEMKVDGTLYAILVENGLNKSNMVENKNCCFSMIG